MKLVAYQTENLKKTGVLDNRKLYDVSALNPAWRSILDIINAGEEAITEIKQQYDSLPPLDESEITYLPPIPSPSKIIAIGANYKDHCLETGLPVPEYPTIFAKFPSCLIGHKQAIVYPPVTEQLDYEVELAFIISKTARNVKREQALDFVFGYTIMNDVTARDLQRNERQWVRAKSLDTFGPCGPCIATKDEIPDSNNLNLSLTVNGKVMQSSNTREMVFDVPYLVEHLSHSFTLYPGDIVTTGTPAGVGMHKVPSGLLQVNDSIEATIEGIGTLSNHVTKHVDA